MKKWLILFFLSTRLLALDTNCEQLLVVTSNNWDTSYAKMWGFEKSSSQDTWIQSLGPIDVQIGKKGMSPAEDFALATHNQELLNLEKKREGDGKSPCGIFAIDTLFGFHSSSFTDMPYLQIHSGLIAVDDSKSKYYNQIINVTEVEKDWDSIEDLSAIPVYEYGAVIDYNQKPAKSNAGSCIYMHIWKGADIGTAGCTAMAKHNLIEVMNWLNKSKNPMIVQMPQEKYQELQKSLELPKI